MLVGPGAGGDRRRAGRGHAREGGHAVVDVDAAGHDRLQRRRAARRDGALEHRGLEAVDDGEDELHRRMRRPAYFCSERRRPPTISQAKKPTTTIASGGKMIAPNAAGTAAAPAENGGAPRASAAPRPPTRPEKARPAG